MRCAGKKSKERIESKYLSKTKVRKVIDELT